LASERRKDLQTNCIPWLVNQINKVMILENGEEEVDAISELISEINGFGSKYNNNNIYNNIYVYIYL